MANILKVTNSSLQNIEDFVAALGDETVGELLASELDHILAVGQLDSKDSRYDIHRNAFFEAVERMIDARVAGNED